VSKEERIHSETRSRS